MIYSALLSSMLQLSLSISMNCASIPSLVGFLKYHFLRERVSLKVMSKTPMTAMHLITITKTFEDFALSVIKN